MRDAYSSPRFEIRTHGDATWIRDVPGIRIVDLTLDSAGGRVIFEAQTDAVSQLVLQLAITRGPVSAFNHQRPSLASIFKEVIQ